MPAGTVPAYLELLADFAAALDVEKVPARVRERLRLIVLDTLGAGLAAAGRPEVARLGTWAAAHRGPAVASLWGQGRTTAPELAALVNGAAATQLELDEGNHWTLGHVAVHVLPATLALGEEIGATGREVLAAVLAGYEVGARLARLGAVRARMHPHGTWGAMAAAAACARLGRADLAEMATALNVGAALALVTSRQTIAEGATVKYLFTGVANQLGLQALRFARAGFTGEADGPGSLFAVLSEAPEPGERVVEGLGRQWEAERNYFKVHACCRYAAPSVDAMLELRSRLGLRPDDVAEIRVSTFDRGARLGELRSHHELAARFSLPYCMAAAAVLGQCGLEAFAPAALGDARILGLARQTVVVEDPEATAAFPAATAARVTVRLRDGSVHQAAVRHALGDPERPLDGAALRAKFLGLATRSLPPDGAEALAERVLRLDEIEQLAEVAALLRGPAPVGERDER